MFAIVDFVLSLFSDIIDILNTKFFSDFDVTFLQLILGTIVLKFIIHFMTGGFKEVDKSSDFFIPHISMGIKNINRKQQLVNKNKISSMSESERSKYLKALDAGIDDLRNRGFIV